ncbi:glycosyltransferase [Nocardia sp. NPDC060256]|uniref:glycosyltransferase n=1 Tax=unclassified Nocardia TaxID=2637762 RepID=UPI003654083A
MSGRFDLEHIFRRPAGAHFTALSAMPSADVVVGDTWAVAVPWLHESTGVPTATIGVNPLLFPSIDAPPAGLGMTPIGAPFNRARNRFLDTIVRKVALAPSVRVADDVRRQIGLPRARRNPLAYAARTQLYLQLSPPEFEYPRRDLPEHVHFLGYPIAESTAYDKPAWWDRLDGRVVLVTQGTVAVDPATVLRPTLAALADRDVFVVAATGGAPVESLDPLPDNAVAERFIPFDELLPHVDVLVTNGGFGGVQRAIAHGVPLVVAGTTEDKKDVNARVAHSGVGIDLRTETPTAAAIGTAVTTVLADDRYRKAAVRVRDSAPKESPAGRGTDLLEQLAAQRTHEPVAERGR